MKATVIKSDPRALENQGQLSDDGVAIYNHYEDAEYLKKYPGFSYHR